MRGWLSLSLLIEFTKVSTLKNLDLRLELKKQANLILKAYNDLTLSMEVANTCRIRSLAARSRIGSCDEMIWNDKHAKNQKDMVSFERFIKVPDAYRDSLSQKELETEIIMLHKISIDLNAIQEYYEESQIENKEHGKELKADSIRKMEMFTGHLK
ncbi:MAG: hypothetical protein QNK36_06270 [Colwellia sp.]|nr:hypothetical protein [Colwellia sp.]